ncbi:hypothetical protein LUZ60_009837 [Juncus effusus]|nr:hypothetical protein LUZ60_009837 [Juncus effusus]
MAMTSSKSLLLLLTLIITLLSLPFLSLSDDCPYPCLPPPQIQTPVYPSPPPPQTPVYSNYPPPQNPETPYWNYPPPASQGYFQPPAGGGYNYPAPPPPDKIVPWYPWYTRTPSSSSVGLLPPFILNLVLVGGLLMGLNLVCW